MRPNQPSSRDTQSPLLSVLAVVLLLALTVPMIGSVAATESSQSALENPLEHTMEAGEANLDSTQTQNDLGSGQIFYSHNTESQIIIGGDQKQVFRVLSARLNATRVVEGKSVKLTVIVDNTGVQTLGNPPGSGTPLGMSATVNPAADAQVDPIAYQVSVAPGGQKKFSYNISFSDEGDYTIQVSNTNIQKEVEVVNKSSSVYDAGVDSAVERQSVSKIVTSYKDELNGSSHPAFNPSIPPVVESSNGTFVNSAIGRIYDFGQAQTNNNNASLTLDGNDTEEELIVGTAFENVPNQNHYTIQLNYDMEPDTSVPVEDRNVQMQVVRQDGSVIDPDTRYMLDANTSTSGRETRYFSLSKEEIEYVQNNKNIYLVYTSDSAPEVDIYYKRVISSNKILETTSGRTQVSNVEVERPGGATYDPTNNNPINTFNPVTIKVSKTNNGDAVVTRNIVLDENGESIDSKSVTLNPGETKTVTFVKYRDTGYYTYSSEGYGAIQVQVGNPGGSGNLAPVARIDTSIPRIGDAFVPTGENAADDTSASFTLDASASSDPNGDSLSYSWRIDGTEVATTPAIDGSYFNSEGTKQVELVVSDGTDSSVSRMTIKINDFAPTSQFTARPSSAPQGVSVQFDATDAVDRDGNIMSYEWSIDGTTVQTSPDPFLDHTFNTLGTKSVTLRTVDDDGNVNTRTQNIQVYESSLTPTFTADPSNPRVNSDVELDATGSTTDNGSITDYRWYNGDGQLIGTGGVITHQFEDQGAQVVELEIENSEGSTASVTRSFDVAPPFEAVATVDNAQQKVSQTFYFNSYGSEDPQNAIESYEWDMDDGQTFTGQEVFHQFENPGTYNVTLTVTGDGYSDTDSVQVEVTSTPPIAVAQFNASTFLANTVEVFGDESRQPGGYITGYYWDFGDGYTTNGDSAQHRYSQPTNNTDTDTQLRDPYNVTLTVTGQYGGTDTDNVSVEVMNRGPYNDYRVTQTGDSRNDGTGADYEGWISNDFTLDGSPSYHFEDPVADIQVYRWVITRPDGTTYVRNGETVNENFDQIGEYEVKYQIRDQWNYWNNTSFTIDIDARPPKASFTYDPQEPGPSEPVNYDGSSSAHNEPDGNIVAYEWNFGDGTGNQSGETTSHVFAGSSSQTYTATLTVRDQWGQTDTVTKTITTDPYQSCHELLINREDASSGYYPIDPDQDDAGTFQVYCNMDYDGGGWTVIDKQTMWDFGQDMSYNIRANGDLYDWDVGPNDVWSVDGGGDHSFVYSVDTGFSYAEMRVVDYKLGATSYRVGGSTSEMRGSNTALSNWNGLNSGGVSGDGGFGTANSVLDSYNNAYEGNCPNGHSWPTCGQYHGGSDVVTPTSGTPYFWDNGDTYQVEASSIAVGWGESGGQREGWEWERGEFWIRQPVGTLIYFYDNGNNIKNYQQHSVNNGYVNFQSNQVTLDSNSGDTTIRNSDNIDLSRYNTIYVDYILTVDNGGSGYVELNVNGRTARDEINQNYLVNDGSLEIDVSDMSDSNANVDVTAHASNSDTTVEVQRIWGREGGVSGTTTVYNSQFNGDTDGWTTSSSNNLETVNGWMRLQCDTGTSTDSISKTFSPSIDANSINYEVSFAATDSWDDENLELQFRDDSGWNTVQSTTPDWSTSDGSDTVYDCRDGNWGSVEYTWSGSYNVDGQITDVRFVLGKDQDDEDEGIAIDYITIERN